MLTALTDVSSYAQQTGLTTPQLQSIGDVNRDGKFSNVDIQSLLDKVAGRAGGSSISGQPAGATDQNKASTEAAVHPVGVPPAAIPQHAETMSAGNVSASTISRLQTSAASKRLATSHSLLRNPDRSIDFVHRVGIETNERPPLTFRGATSPEVDLKFALPMDHETPKSNRSRRWNGFPVRQRLRILWTSGAHCSR